MAHNKSKGRSWYDLTDKFYGKEKTKNNPWQNAYAHASHCDVETSADIRKSIKKSANSYIYRKFNQINNFNVIPCATIFLENIWNLKSRKIFLERLLLFYHHLKARKYGKCVLLKKL